MSPNTIDTDTMILASRASAPAAKIKSICNGSYDYGRSDTCPDICDSKNSSDSTHNSSHPTWFIPSVSHNLVLIC